MKKIVVIDGTVSVNSEVYTQGEEIPQGVLSRRQITDLESAKCIEQVPVGKMAKGDPVPEPEIEKEDEWD